MLDLGSLGLSAEDFERIIAQDPAVAAFVESYQADGYHTFRPRPDDPANFDQQASFCQNRDLVSFLIGGNAAGTTEAAAFKASQFMLRQQPPPRKDTPFWVLSNTYDQVGDVIWKEKFIGHGHIPRCEIDWNRISWRDQKKQHPDVVPLKPWVNGDERCNWAIHFKSYEQGRAALQAASIGGFLFSEQFPGDLFLETLRGCREYMFPGGQFAEFTPIDPELCIWVEHVMERTPPGWAFYRANTAKNRINLADGWFESFFGTVPDELLLTRLTGALATFEGVIYQSFNPAVHVLDFEVPPGCRHGLATDWGSSIEHPHTSVFGAEDGIGTWWIYDEYWSTEQSKTLEDHCRATIAQAEQWGWPAKDEFDRDKRIQRRLKVSAEYRANVADPSRPGNLTEYTIRGLPSLPARNAVYDGINHVRSLLKLQPTTGLPRLFIHPRCRHLIEEMRKYRWIRGKKSVPGILNPKAGTPEPLKKDDDTCFPAGTMVATPGGEVPIETIKPGDAVLTHRGTAIVHAAALTGIKPTIRLKLDNGSSLMCTATHQLAAENGTWLAASQSLGRKVDCLDRSSWTKTQSDRPSELPTEDLFGTDTRPTKLIPIGDTSAAAQGKAKESSERSNFTNKYGAIIAARFQRARTFTTSTKIQPTTNRRISKPFPSQSTENCMRQRVSQKRERAQLSGIGRTLEGSGTKNTARKHGSAEKLQSTSVLIAERSTAVGMEIKQVSCFARDAAGITPDTNQGSITSKGHASSARSRFQSIVTARRNAARSHVRPSSVGLIEQVAGEVPVYCLATSDGTFFANGVLVSNCDALRYLLFSHAMRHGLTPQRSTATGPRHQSIQAQPGTTPNRYGIQLKRPGQR